MERLIFPKHMQRTTQISEAKTRPDPIERIIVNVVKLSVRFCVLLTLLHKQSWELTSFLRHPQHVNGI